MFFSWWFDSVSAIGSSWMQCARSRRHRWGILTENQYDKLPNRFSDACTYILINSSQGMHSIEDSSAKQVKFFTSPPLFCFPIVSSHAFYWMCYIYIGACEEVKAAMLKYQSDVTIAPMICRAIFILVSGSSEHKVTYSVIPIEFLNLFQ